MFPKLSLTPACLSLVILCIGIHLSSILQQYIRKVIPSATWSHSNLIESMCLVGSTATFLVQPHRIIAHGFIHGNLLHLVMNMGSLCQIGVEVEKKYGSFAFYNLVATLLTLSSILYYWLVFSVSFLVSLLELVVGSHLQSTILNQSGSIILSGLLRLDGVCMVGFSGVLFGMMTLQIYSMDSPNRISLFGSSDNNLFSVPAKYYPFIVMIIIQLLFPAAAFYGHLTGILAGIALARNSWLKQLIHARYVRYFDQKFGPWLVERVPGFVRDKKAAGGTILPVARKLGS